MVKELEQVGAAVGDVEVTLARQGRRQPLHGAAPEPAFAAGPAAFSRHRLLLSLRRRAGAESATPGRRPRAAADRRRGIVAEIASAVAVAHAGQADRKQAGVIEDGRVMQDQHDAVARLHLRLGLGVVGRQDRRVRGFRSVHESVHGRVTRGAAEFVGQGAAGVAARSAWRPGESTDCGFGAPDRSRQSNCPQSPRPGPRRLPPESHCRWVPSSAPPNGKCWSHFQCVEPVKPRSNAGAVDCKKRPGDRRAS